MNYAREELEALGLAALGERVDVHRTVEIFGASSLALGSDVRIDCHAVITAGPAPVRIGSHVHVAAATHIFGTAGVEVEDFANLSSRVSVFSTSDDYSEGYLTNPTVPGDFRKVHEAPVHVGRHAIVGCGTVVLPGVTIAEGGAVGALSLVKQDVPAYDIVAGVPARRVGRRDAERTRSLERAFLAR